MRDLQDLRGAKGRGLGRSLSEQEINVQRAPVDRGVGNPLRSYAYARPTRTPAHTRCSYREDRSLLGTFCLPPHAHHLLTFRSPHHAQRLFSPPAHHDTMRCSSPAHARRYSCYSSPPAHHHHHLLSAGSPGSPPAPLAHPPLLPPAHCCRPS